MNAYGEYCEAFFGEEKDPDRKRSSSTGVMAGRHQRSHSTRIKEMLLSSFVVDLERASRKRCRCCSFWTDQTHDPTTVAQHNGCRADEHMIEKPSHYIDGILDASRQTVPEE